MDFVLRVMRAAKATISSSVVSEPADVEPVSVESAWQTTIGSSATNRTTLVRGEYIMDGGVKGESSGCCGGCAKRVLVVLRDVKTGGQFELHCFGPIAEKWEELALRSGDTADVINPDMSHHARKDSTLILSLGSPITRENLIPTDVDRKIVVRRSEGTLEISSNKVPEQAEASLQMGASNSPPEVQQSPTQPERSPRKQQKSTADDDEKAQKSPEKVQSAEAEKSRESPRERRETPRTPKKNAARARAVQKSTIPKTYSMLSECTDTSRNVKYNVYGVVKNVSRLPTATKSGRLMSQVHLRDPSYKGCHDHPDFQFSMLGWEKGHFVDLSVGSVLRIHHMAVEEYCGKLDGRVFDSRSVAILAEAERDDRRKSELPDHRSVNFVMTAEDERRAQELVDWWRSTFSVAEVSIGDLDPKTVEKGGRLALTVSVLSHAPGRSTGETLMRVTDGTDSSLCFLSLDRSGIDSEHFDPTLKRHRLSFDIFVQNEDHANVLKAAVPGRKVKISGVRMAVVRGMKDVYELSIAPKQPASVQVIEGSGDTDVSCDADTIETFVGDPLDKSLSSPSPKRTLDCASDLPRRSKRLRPGEKGKAAEEEEAASAPNIEKPDSSEGTILPRSSPSWGNDDFPSLNADYTFHDSQSEREGEMSDAGCAKKSKDDDGDDDDDDRSSSPKRKLGHWNKLSRSSGNASSYQETAPNKIQLRVESYRSDELSTKGEISASKQVSDNAHDDRGGVSWLDPGIPSSMFVRDEVVTSQELGQPNECEILKLFPSSPDPPKLCGSATSDPKPAGGVADALYPEVSLAELGRGVLKGKYRVRGRVRDVSPSVDTLRRCPEAALAIVCRRCVFSGSLLSVWKHRQGPCPNCGGCGKCLQLYFNVDLLVLDGKDGEEANLRLCGLSAERAFGCTAEEYLHNPGSKSESVISCLEEAQRMTSAEMDVWAIRKRARCNSE